MALAETGESRHALKFMLDRPQPLSLEESARLAQVRLGPFLDRTWNAPPAVAPMTCQTLAHLAGVLATVRPRARGSPVIVNTLSDAASRT
jgi:hypothetical protein